jgi:hypothetical protein
MDTPRLRNDFEQAQIRRARREDFAALISGHRKMGKSRQGGNCVD